ncbi:Nicotinamide mononucleotide adenylyltransferase [Madurella mycetomatis]|uniref:Nicotinamide mononucleotide adenylyltransferase n=1 Tax=Madurella mycetomatis TaxID=100816 RepID=A0A175VP71_9PEZI|nr:Nicotinamide mononucleotide adenylyltransferase [Madurella mycetomatis]
MPAQAPTSAHSLINFFSRSLSAFQSSGSKLHIVCTAAPAPQHRGSGHHGQPTPLPPRARPCTLIVLDSSFNPPTRAHLRMAASAVHDLADKEGQRPAALRLLLLLSVNNADKTPKPAAFDKRLAMMWAFARDLQQQRQQQQQGQQGEQGEPEPSSAEDGRAHDEGLSIDLGLSTLPYFHEKSAAIAESEFYKGEGDGGDAKMEQLILVGYDTLIRIFNPKYYGSPGSVADGVTSMRRALAPFFARARLRVTLRTDDEWGNEEEQRAYLESLWKADGLGGADGSREWEGRIEMVEGRRVGADIISSTYARAAARDRDQDRLDALVTPEVRWWIDQERLYAE